jgi:subtilase family serine protease
MGGVEGERGSIDPPSTPFVERITPAGFDNTFGYGGMVNIYGVAAPEATVVLTLQPDGKILAADTDLFRLTAV